MFNSFFRDTLLAFISGASLFALAYLVYYDWPFRYWWGLPVMILTALVCAITGLPLLGRCIAKVTDV